MNNIKKLPHFITSLRFVCAIMMLCVEPFSQWFWLFYGCGGLTDILDGFIARLLHQQSDIGAKLDSIADFVFALVIGYIVIINVNLPSWIWIVFIVVVMIRGTSYIIGYYKYHTFSSLHTYLNKIAGMLIFIVPLLYILIGMIWTVIIISFITMISALEELFIIIMSKELNRDCEHLLIKIN